MFNNLSSELTDLVNEINNDIFEKVQNINNIVLDDVNKKIKNEISKANNPPDFYDYSNIELETFTFGNINKKRYLDSNFKSIEGMLRFFKNQLDSGINSKYLRTNSKLLSRHFNELNVPSNEKWVIKVYLQDKHIPDKQHIIFISNYSRFLCLSILPKCNNYSLQYNNLDFWLPIDYINIYKDYLNIFNNNSYAYTSSFIDSLYNILVKAKNTLYNRKYVPHWLDDVINENNNIKERTEELNEYEQRLKDSEEVLIQKQNEFNMFSKDYFDIKKEKKSIESRKKILMVSQNKIFAEKSTFETEMAERKAEFQREKEMELSKIENQRKCIRKRKRTIL